MKHGKRKKFNKICKPTPTKKIKMDKFKNKYRISSARLQSWDYGANGAYFITICTKNREHFFGKIVNNEL